MLALMVLSASGDFRQDRVVRYPVRSDCCECGSLPMHVVANMSYRHT